MTTDPALDDLADEFRESLRLALYIARNMDAETNLSATQVSILKMAAGDGLRVSEIARNLGVKVPSATEQIIRLEGAGLVVRSPDPHDSRGVRVILTPVGAKELREANGSRTALMATLLEQLSGEERNALAQALPVIRRLSKLPGA
ncbi:MULTISPECIES: MarR family winged helix-turn-helix transcriptional regulator [unclassified Arthrobacter]|uniref:MarR family winged helix-turn-helix transcriptional regulator n=1 Tax=unclassified Arthrobacter TaxID=235627 RepID=UPI001D1539CB|nr:MULTISPECIES: MarR family winged helix-turn-helix transcriptional regulator [unclassified Arthrobacter]MCC3276014.1 MarR family winged helix-turn-helix transcriptional regulator [Arthrobacter sp. zg-Y20]MCC3278003.1 MarR family winged helix-turn-helix transcriptional regulator [Arthrobacter sp. zg-Y40]MCC9176401.1 MarR family winged helix-turn-helix transcriptional regulator [Arthrobacter sp. zg-Y750]MDK1316171.1 MarR family winged helix-turn-helix transcriptional regulator [Arthrobacter sp.